MMKTDKRERILRVILNYPKGSLYAYRIAKEAECSRSWVIDFLHKLEKMKLIKKISNISDSNRRMEGIYVINVIGIFDYWIKISHSSYIREYHVKNPIQCLEKTNLKYALTTYQAETLTQNYLFPSRIDLYIREEDIEKWHKLFTKNGLIGKGNVKIIIEDEHVFYNSKQKKGFEIVSIPQLIIDLLKEGGVAEEAAIMLIRKKYNEIIS